MRVCGNPKCAMPKQPETAFGKNKAMKDGYANYCKICQRNAAKVSSKKYPEKNAAKARRLRKELKEKNPNKAWSIRRNQRLKAEYGITLDRYNEMFAEQNGNCAICSRNSKEFPKGLVVDHCHVTGKVRALLCGLCNQLLGQAKENVITLGAAVLYLGRHK